MCESNSATMSPTPKSFLREWGLLIGFGVFMASAIVAYRLWTDFQANAPVVAVYREYLDDLSQRSPRAASHRDRYFQAFKRNSVASQHFEQVCAVMTRLAESERVNTDAKSPEIGLGCRRLGRFYVEDDLPAPE